MFHVLLFISIFDKVNENQYYFVNITNKIADGGSKEKIISNLQTFLD